MKEIVCPKLHGRAERKGIVDQPREVENVTPEAEDET